MKTRIITIAAAALTLAACAQKQEMGVATEIAFQTANHLQTKAASYENGPFGVYAWYKGETSSEDVDDFMVNQQVVGKDGSNELWRPTVTYYWPKTGSINFVAYSPYSTNNAPVITETSFKFNGFDPDEDLMYSDWALGQTADNTINGVPIIFHHALARVAFAINASYKEIYDPETQTYTRWEIIIPEQDLMFKNIKNSGTLELTLGADGKWVRPTSNVWTSDGQTDEIKVHFAEADITAEGYVATNVAMGNYLLPQEVANQVISLNCTIKTYRVAGVSGLDEGRTATTTGAANTPVLVETSVNISGKIQPTVSASVWGINQVTIYNIKLTPAADGKILVPVYIQDKDHDGQPDLGPDGKPIETTNPDDALQDPEGNPVPVPVPVYPVDKDGDGQPDLNPDGSPVVTTDPDEGMKEPIYVVDKDGDGEPDLNPDGTPVTTNDPDEAMKDPDGKPVMPVDKDGDGKPDVGPDGKPITTTDPDEGMDEPLYIQDKDGDGKPDVGPDGKPIVTPDPDDALETDKKIEEKSEGPIKITFNPMVVQWDAINADLIQ